MFKKIALFMFAVGVTAGAYASSNECYDQCDAEFTACLNSGDYEYYKCKSFMIRCKSSCDF